MRRTLSLVLAVLLAPAVGFAGDKDILEGIGFSSDGTVFAYYTYGVFDGSGMAHAELNVFSVLTGKRNEAESKKVQLENSESGPKALAQLKAEVAPRLAALKLGKDPGVEMYRSGTAYRTSFTAAGKPLEVLLDVNKGAVDEDGIRKDRVTVRLVRNGKRHAVYVGGGGFDYSLNSVRLSADGRSLAILLKHSERGFEGPNRRYLCVAARLPAG